MCLSLIQQLFDSKTTSKSLTGIVWGDHVSELLLRDRLLLAVAFFLEFIHHGDHTVETFGHVSPQPVLRSANTQPTVRPERINKWQTKKKNQRNKVLLCQNWLCISKDQKRNCNSCNSQSISVVSCLGFLFLSSNYSLMNGRAGVCLRLERIVTFIGSKTGLEPVFLR